MKNNKGFTLIELLAVIVILAIIITIAVQGTMSVSNKMKNKMYESKLEFILNAAKLYGEDHIDNLPNECIKVKTLIENNYLKKDNKNGNPYIQDPRDKSNKNGLDDMCVYIAKKNNRIAASFDPINGGSSIDENKILVSTKNECIYSGNTCKISEISEGIELDYKPDGSTAVSFYVLADDGEILTLISKESIGYKKLGSVGSHGDLYWSVINSIEEATSNWNYVNKQNYTIDKSYYINVDIVTKDGSNLYYPSFESENAYSWQTISRNNVNARLITAEEALKSLQSPTYNFNYQLDAKYSWLSGFGWTSGLYNKNDDMYVEYYEIASYNALYLNSSGNLALSNIAATKPIHPVIEISKSSLIK